MTSKNETIEPLKNQEINYFRVIWNWKWAAILIPLIAMVTAKLVERPIPSIYETKTSMVISGYGTQKPLSYSSFQEIAFLPAILQKIIDQLSLKMADGTSMDQKTLTNQLIIPFSLAFAHSEPAKPGFLFFVARNENPDLAKKIADLWLRLITEEVKKLELVNYLNDKKNYIARLEKNWKTFELPQIAGIMEKILIAELKVIEKKSELSTYQRRLKTFSNSRVQFFAGQREPSTIIQHDNSALKNELPPIPSQDRKESSGGSTETTLHAALKGLIFNKELEIRSLEDQIHFLKTNFKKKEQEFFGLAQKEFLSELFKKFDKNQVKFHKDFESSIISLNEAAVNTVPVPRTKNIQIFLAGLISFGLVLLACVLKAHFDAMRHE